jgi:signal peptidase II
MAEVELTEQKDGAPSLSAPPSANNVVVALVAPSVLRRYLAIFAGVALITLVLDQASKAWIRAALPMGEQLPLWPGWVHLSHVLNHGAAWGILGGQRIVLIAVTLLVLVGVLTAASQIVARGGVAATGLGLILGGALGNLIDRALRGAVTDMIDLDTPVLWLQNFPVFNVADSALTVGVCLLLVDLLILEGRRESVQM